MNRYLRLLLALITGILLLLLYPPFDISVLAPIALTPLVIVATREMDWRWRFGLGYVSGLVYWFGLCNWIQWTLSQYAGVSGAAAWALFVLFCLAKSIQLGVFGLLAGPLMRVRFAILPVAALWVALEWTHGVLGFQWLQLGNAGSEMSVPLRVAPLAGVWGVSFVFALMAAGIAGALLRRPRRELLPVLLLLVLMLLPPIPQGQRGNAAAVLLQPNLSEITVWTPELIGRSLQVMTLLSAGPTSSSMPTDLVVWPELPGPFAENDPEYMSTLARVAVRSHAGLIAGAVGRSAAGAPLNSAVALDAHGKEVSRYDKINLVPFGEFVPWPFKQITKQVSSEAGDFEAGNSAMVSKAGAHTVGTFICYESVFPSFIRKFAANGAEVLVNISNDGWFGRSAARYQHLRIVRMRAVENRRWILRATNNGVTVVIDPAGRVLQSGPEFIASALHAQFRYAQGTTFYTRWGDWFVLVCALAGAAGLIAAFRTKAEPQPQSEFLQ